MTVLVDTSIIIDVLRGREAARGLLRDHVAAGLHASEITRIEVLAGMRPAERAATERLLGAFSWHAIDEDVARAAGALGQRWLPGHSGIGAADLAIAATAETLGLELLTLNVKHFPMIDGLRAPY